MDVFLTKLDVFLPVSGCKNVSIGCIYDSNSLYDCIIGRGLYTLTNIHPVVFLLVVKMPCTQYFYYNFVPSGMKLARSSSIQLPSGSIQFGPATNLPPNIRLPQVYDFVFFLQGCGSRFGRIRIHLGPWIRIQGYKLKGKSKV